MYKILGWGHYKRFLFCKLYFANFICCMVRGAGFPQNPITNTLQSVWFSSTTCDINTPTLPPQVCITYKKNNGVCLVDRQRLLAMKTVCWGYTCTRNKYTEWKRRKTRLVQINTQKYFTMSSLQNYHTLLLQESHSSYIK